MKKVGFILALLMLLIPINVGALTYTSTNLEEALLEEEIEKDYKNYEENDKQAIIYMFRGKGCVYCKKFLTYLNSITNEYGKYFKLISYEVWRNADNSSLMSDVAATLNKEITGVPFIIIGEKTFEGYSEEYDEDIKKAIMVEYKNGNKNDIMKDVKEGAGKALEEENEQKEDTDVIDERYSNTSSKKSSNISTILILVVICISSVITLIYINLKYKALSSQIADLSIKDVNKKKTNNNK